MGRHGGSEDGGSFCFLLLDEPLGAGDVITQYH